MPMTVLRVLPARAAGVRPWHPSQDPHTLNGLTLILRGGGMGKLVVREWRRYGQDRLYLNDSDTSRSVGFYDRKTGKITVHDKSREYEALDALKPFLHGSAPLAVQRTMEATPLSDSDLGDNRAGAAVSERAAELAPGWFQRFAARLFGYRTAATSWEVGSAGERLVGARLDRLKRDGWHVFHSAQLASGADIDHIVIGPPGVFTINTKHHAKARIWVGTYALKVNGFQQPYLRKSESEARSAGRRLTRYCGMEVKVTPVLAFVGAARIKLTGPPPPVLIMRGEDADRSFRALPRVLSDVDQSRIVTVARRPEIWRA